jgi:hypothetical protein
MNRKNVSEQYMLNFLYLKKKNIVLVMENYVHSINTDAMNLKFMQS